MTSVLPSGLSFVPDFITKDQHDSLLKYINEQKWDTSISRRVQHYGYQYPYQVKVSDKRQLIPTTAIPELFKAILQPLLLTAGYIKEHFPDQAIVNEYTPGQGIYAHTDNSAVFAETVISLTLGSGCTMIFRKDEQEVNIYLPPRSLVVLTGEARYKWTHEIKRVKTDMLNDKKIPRNTRVSITLRNTL